LLRQRVDALRTKNPDRDLLISWNIQGRGELLNHLHHGGMSDRVLARLRKEFGHASPAAWSVAIDCHEPFMRPRGVVRTKRQSAAMCCGNSANWKRARRSAGLEEFFPKGLANGPYGELATIGSADRGTLLGRVEAWNGDVALGENDGAP